MKVKCSVVAAVALASLAVAVPVGLAGSSVGSADPNNPTMPLTLVSSAKTTMTTTTTETRTYRDAAGQTFRATLALTEGPILNGGTDASHMYVGTAPHGCRKMYGRVKFDNSATVNLWTMYAEVYWCWQHWTVDVVWGNVVRPESSCCNWTWAGVTDHRTSPTGGPNFWFYAAGQFNSCLLGFCNNMHPWLHVRGNGAGHQTAYEWGIG